MGLAVSQYLTPKLFLQLELHVHLVPRAGRERDGDGDGHDDAAADHREPQNQPLHEAQAPVQGDGGPVKVSGEERLRGWFLDRFRNQVGKDCTQSVL